MILRCKIENCDDRLYDALLGHAHSLGFENIVHEGSTAFVFQPAAKMATANILLREFTRQNPVVLFDEKWEEVKSENWQTEWQKYYHPITVGAFCVAPEWETAISHKIAIKISPKMAFGTGTHESTQLILQAISDLDVKDARVLDLGCGSGILSIAVSKLGAAAVDALDIDADAISNCRENLRLNEITAVVPARQDLSGLPQKPYDLILANIDKPLLENMSGQIYNYVAIAGLVILAGLLVQDLPEMQRIYEASGFTYEASAQKGEWGLLMLRRIE
jgi:ribosomal protein L11 methyltransferase